MYCQLSCVILNNTNKEEMMRPKIGYLILSICFVLLFFGEALAQGLLPSYYYEKETELDFASCYLYLEGGSRQRIPFMPVNNGNYRAPMGTGRYSKDVAVDGPIVFIGNGFVKEGEVNSYIGRRLDWSQGEIDVSGKVVMFCYDFPDTTGEEAKNALQFFFAKETKLTSREAEMALLASRIAEAAKRKASAVIVFSHKDPYPFLLVNYEKDIPDIPVISITKEEAIKVLASSALLGEEIFKEWEESGTPPESVELISRIKLQIKGDFSKVEREHFSFKFRNEVMSTDEIEQIADINERSLKFLFDCFKDEKLTWKKLITVYFRDFDSKIFYTRHWGWGLASEAGTFMVHKGGVPDFGMAVHENTHILAYLNWGYGSSFIEEGLGKYTEALATDKDKNHLKTINFLKEEKLFPLKEMVTFDIGREGLKTDVGYPAAGSFMEYIVTTYGLKCLKRLFVLEDRPDKEKKGDSWETAFGKPLSKLEKEWLYWLAKRYKVDERYILEHLKKQKGDS
jgi:hypothetical protein